MSLLVSLEISAHSGRAHPNSFAKFNPFYCVLDHARKHFLRIYIIINHTDIVLYAA